MSGIVGIYGCNSQHLHQAELQRMVEVLAHRGPDGAEMWLEGAIGLGHRMLWTTPESLLERLPWVSSGGCVITADARIDNREELIATLAMGDRPAEKITDSELIVAAYECWGDRCLDHLLGDFAFAIWDPHQQQLFCARDHFGVKPFYYYAQEGQFIFASEMKAILALPQVPRRINEVRIGDYLSMAMEDQTITTYQDILRLPPAHQMTVSSTGLQLQCYWSLNPTQELYLESDAAYAEAFQRIFTKAVRCRLRSTFAIGSQLSGGLDSSAVTCVARQLLVEAEQAPLHTISNIFDTITECDERPYIQAVLAEGDLIPHYVQADEVGPLTDVKEIWQYEDEAFTGPNHYLPWGLNRAAQQHGLRVVLDGFDGDTTVSHGLLRLLELLDQGDWQTFVQEAEAIAPRLDLSAQAVIQSYSELHLQQLAKQGRWRAWIWAARQLNKYCRGLPQHLLLRTGLKPLIPHRLKQLWQRLRSGSSSARSMPWINPSFARQIGLEQRIQAQGQSSDPPLTVREEQWRSLTSGVRTYVLEQMDRYAAACGLEMRHPFMDKRLIEFCLALPAQQKLDQGWNRIVMRRALTGILPEVIQWRSSKTDMTPNFVHGLLDLDRQSLEAAILNRSSLLEKYMDADFLQTVYHQISTEGKVGNGDLMMIWRTAILALWLHQGQAVP